ncbi:MAG: hypothetical protein K2X27_06710 [Candidatus Obscuribacterales bacterium]|nr:hypothetical protein [Candidatus Obscuribacterales bacterium]
MSTCKRDFCDERLHESCSFKDALMDKVELLYVVVKAFVAEKAQRQEAVVPGSAYHKALETLMLVESEEHERPSNS